MRYWRVVPVIVVLTALVSGCWSLRPEEHIEFHRHVGISRNELGGGIPVSMEIDGVRLVATAPLQSGGIALYYVPTPKDRIPHLNGAGNVTRIDVVTVGDAAPRRLDAGSPRFDQALAAFPVLHEYSERHWGFDEPDEADGPVSHLAGGELLWNATFTVADTAGSAVSVGNSSGAGTDTAVDPEQSVRVTFQATGTEERGTRSIFAFVETPAGERHRYTLKRSTFDVTRRMTARTQRLFRSVTWDGRYLLLYDRLIDTETGEETPLVDRAPATFVDHLISRDGDVEAIVYGTRRISKQIVISSDGS